MDRSRQCAPACGRGLGREVAPSGTKCKAALAHSHRHRLALMMVLLLVHERETDQDMNQKVPLIHCPSLLGAHCVSYASGWYSVFIREAAPHDVFSGCLYKLKAT